MLQIKIDIQSIAIKFSVGFLKSSFFVRLKYIY